MNDEIEELKIEAEEKEKTKWEKFKEAWHDPKKHALIVLGIWGILFFLAILFVNLNFTRVEKVNTKTSPLETFKDMQSYEFSYKTVDTSLNGMAYEDKYILYLDNEKYYKNSVLYKIPDLTPSTEPELLKINNEMIYNLISNAEGIEKEGYKEYSIPLTTFTQLYENTVSNGNNIVIDLYQKDNKINKVIIDLTNYYISKGINTNSYLLEINYYNINKLNDFTHEYDEIIGGTK